MKISTVFNMLLILLSVISPAILYLIIAAISTVRFFCNPLRNRIPGPAYPVFPITGDVGSHNACSCDIQDNVLMKMEQFGEIFRSSGYYGRIRVQINDPNVARYILVSGASNFSRGSHIGAEGLAAVAGEKNLLMAFGDDHRHLRRIATPGFRPSHILSCAGKIRHRAETLCFRWSDAVQECAPHVTPERNTCAIEHGLTAYTLDCLGWVAMGMDIDSLSSKSGQEFARCLTDLNHHSRVMPIGIFPYWLNFMKRLHNVAISDDEPMWMKHTPFFPFSKPCRKLYEIIKGRLMETKKEQLTFHADQGIKDDAKNFLRQALINSGKGNLSYEETMGLIMIFLLAGSETSSISLAWFLWLLADHAEVQEAVRSECQDFMSRNPSDEEFGQLLTDKGLLQETKLALREAMRLYPVIPFLSRGTLCDEHLGGYAIPKGTDIMINIPGISFSYIIFL